MKKLFSRKTKSFDDGKDAVVEDAREEQQLRSRIDIRDDTFGEDQIKSQNEKKSSHIDDGLAHEREETEKSWDSVSGTDSFSTVESSATINTLKYFGLTNHRGKSIDDVTIDAFMDIKDKNSRKSNKSFKPQNLKPVSVDPQHSDLHTTALSCIAKQDYEQLMRIIDSVPEILCYECEKKALSRDLSNDTPHLNGCHGGTILHVLVSQKPSLKKKRVKQSNSTKKGGLFTNVLSSREPVYEMYIMPSVPHSILLSVIKKQSKALHMVDKYGRLPIHCATLSLSAHLEEMNKLYNTPNTIDTGKGFFDLSRVVVKEINLVHLLLQFNEEGARIRDSKGNLPIHYAVAISSDHFEFNVVRFAKSNKYVEPSSNATVSQLLRAYPRSLGVRNEEGSLPIHVICAQGESLNLMTLKQILNSNHIYKDDLTRKNQNGDTPLLLAIKKRANVDAIRLFPSHLFAHRDSKNNNILHVALRMSPSANVDVIREIMTLAPFIASVPDFKGKMPIRYATEQRIAEDVIRQMLARDMPIQIGTNIDLKNLNRKRVARHVVERSHYHSWWHILMDENDTYLDMVKSFLSEEATHAQIVTLARQIGPDGNSILYNCVSKKCRLMFHELLRFYDKYEILLSAKDETVKPEEVIDGVQTFLALDHGLSTTIPSENYFSELYDSSSNLTSSTSSLSNAIWVRNDSKDKSGVEVSLLSKEKSKVVLRCYQYDEAFFAEIKVREKYDFPRQYFEEIYNYHRDESYTYLALSKAEKLCCITFERPDHTLADVFVSVSSGGQRSQKWVEKCWIVLKQLASSLNYLHNQNLIHGHLDPPNIAKYGNIWKIGKLGTVTKKGSAMRGKFRSSVPPESIIESTPPSSSKWPKFNAKLLSKAESPHQRVKFSSSVDEVTTRCMKSKVDLRQDKLVKSSVSQDDAPSEPQHYDFMSFLRFNNTPSKVIKGIHEEKSVEETCATFVAERCQATPQWDMWGFGLIMVQLLLGRCMLLPNFEKADDAILKKLHTFNDKTLDNICTLVSNTAGPDAANLIAKLLQKDPSRRPKSFIEVLEHDYFQALTIYV